MKVLHIPRGNKMNKKTIFSTETDKKIFWIQIAILLPLLVILIVVSTKKGVWSTSNEFYSRKATSDQSVSYTNKKKLTVKVDNVENETNKKKITFEFKEEQIRWVASWESNGSFKYIDILDASNNLIWKGSYLENERTIESNSTDFTYGDIETLSFKDGTKRTIQMKAVCQMIFDTPVSKIHGNAGVVSFGVLFLGLGIMIILFKKYLIKLDILIEGIFYNNNRELEPNEVMEFIMTLPGVISYIVGVACIVIFICS